jgi:hypothetical protein
MRADRKLRVLSGTPLPDKDWSVPASERPPETRPPMSPEGPVHGAAAVNRIKRPYTNCRPCPYHLGHPGILMMEPAEERDGHD